MKMIAKHWQRIAVTLIPLVFALLHAMGQLTIGVLQRLDDIIYDARLRATMPRTLDERIVIVEDSTELAPDHPHVVRMQARTPNVEGSGTVTLRDLVRQALRMRPDRLVLGEVRGVEVIDLLAAMNTGHEGGMGTVHANSATDVPSRLEALGLMAGIDRHAVHALIAAAVDVIVHLGRDGGGRRIVSGIHVLVRDDEGFVRAVPALALDGGRLAGADAMSTLDVMLMRT